MALPPAAGRYSMNWGGKMRKLSVYVETSVWSNALADDAPQQRTETEEFLADARRGMYQLFISEVVMEEVARAPDELACRLRALISELKPALLTLDDDSMALSEEYVRHGAVPPTKADDAKHVAIALTNDLDVLVSWNYRHLVNVRRRDLFHHVGVTNGYVKDILIITPPELTDVA
jgi:hypothetical protein